MKRYQTSDRQVIETTNYQQVRLCLLPKNGLRFFVHASLRQNGIWYPALIFYRWGIKTRVRRYFTIWGEPAKPRLSDRYWTSQATSTPCIIYMSCKTRPAKNCTALIPKPSWALLYFHMVSTGEVNATLVSASMRCQGIAPSIFLPLAIPLSYKIPSVTRLQCLLLHCILVKLLWNKDIQKG